MPSTLTHYIFNSQNMENVKYKNLFLVAGQGPDAFFFYGYNLKKRSNKKEIRNFGIYLHQIDPSDLYIAMLRYAFSKKDDERDMLINFTRGFMYHYALDRNCHPYIFYNTGFPYTNHTYNVNHGIFESNLDTLLMKRYNYKISTRKSLKVSSKQIKVCSKMIYYVAKEVYDNQYLDEYSYYRAWRDYRFVRLMIDSRFGIKKWLFSKLCKNSPMDIASQPKKVKDDDKLDYLNNNHRTWIIPSTGDEVNYSFLELMDKAKLECRIIDNIIYNYKDNIVTQRKIRKLVNNINHDGRDLDNYMTYFKTIWNNN